MKVHFKVSTSLESLDQVLSNFDKVQHTQIPQQDWWKCRLALTEGFTNAVRHAHKNLAEDIPIEIQLTLRQQRLEIRIWDYGKPFNLNKFAHNQPHIENNWSEHGRGISILQQIADCLSYERTDANTRNCLLIVKNFIPVEQKVNP